MAQLKMYWKNDGTELPALSFPAGVSVQSLPETPNGLDTWKDVIRYMSKNFDTDTSGDYYDRSMLQQANYNENMCYIFSVDGEPAATVTVICDQSAKAGRIHMVACKPGFRGHGLGNLMMLKAMTVMQEAGMETAALVTDDWRIPAIKTYLKVGFTPDLDSEPDYKERWDKIFAVLNAK